MLYRVGVIASPIQKLMPASVVEAMHDELVAQVNNYIEDVLRPSLESSIEHVRSRCPRFNRQPLEWG